MDNSYICVPNKFMDELNGMSGNEFVVSLAFLYKSYEEWNGQTVFKYLKDIMELIGIKNKRTVNTAIDDLVQSGLVWDFKKGKLYTCTCKYVLFADLGKGYHKYPVGVLKNNDLTANDKMIYGYLLRIYGSNGNDVYPKEETIATDLALSERMVRDGIGRLEKFGFLAVKRDIKSYGNGEVRKKNYYKPRVIIKDEKLTTLDESVIVNSYAAGYKNYSEQMPDAKEEIIEEVF